MLCVFFVVMGIFYTNCHGSTHRVELLNVHGEKEKERGNDHCLVESISSQTAYHNDHVFRKDTTLRCNIQIGTKQTHDSN